LHPLVPIWDRQNVCAACVPDNMRLRNRLAGTALWFNSVSQCRHRP